MTVCFLPSQTILSCAFGMVLKKQELNKALVGLPFLVVKDVGFGVFVHKAHLCSYNKAGFEGLGGEKKYTENKKKAKSNMQKATAVNPTSNICTSTHMDA